MRKFHYEAINDNGEVLEGEMHASSRSAVIEKLLAKGHTPIDASEIGRIKTGFLFSGWRRSKLDIVRFTRDLKNLLTAGVSLERAIEMLSDLNEDQASQEVTTQLLEDLRGGATLSSAMSQQPQVFNALYTSLIHAGEAGGALQTVLEYLADYLEQQKALKSNVLNALAYPVILIVVTIISLVILMVFVVPKFTQLFEEMGAELPLPSRIVFSAGEFLQGYGWLLVVLMIALFFALRRLSSDPRFLARRDRTILKTPLLGDLIKKLQVSVFTRALGTLLLNGVPLVTALNIVRETLTSSTLRTAMQEVIVQVEEGHGLSKPISRSEYFPKLVSHLIEVGEESGKLSATLLELARIYDDEVKDAVKRMITIIEPVLIIGLGLVIGGVIMSILMTLLSVNDLVI